MTRYKIYLTVWVLLCLILPAKIHAAEQSEVRNPVYLSYIEQWAPTALAQQEQYGIPASITLAQGLLESGAGQSDLATIANNHFGIKCHNTWEGKTYHKDDDARDECFRSYVKAEDSFHDHSLFLKRPRYEVLFTYNIKDYKKWAYGLKDCGYATDPKYPQKLIQIIETYGLNDLKKPSAKTDKTDKSAQTEKPAKADKPTKAEKADKHNKPVAAKPAATKPAVAKPVVTPDIPSVPAKPVTPDITTPDVPVVPAKPSMPDKSISSAKSGKSTKQSSKPAKSASTTPTEPVAPKAEIAKPEMVAPQPVAVAAKDTTPVAKTDTVPWTPSTLRTNKLFVDHAFGKTNGRSFIVAQEGDTWGSMAYQLGMEEKTLRRINEAGSDQVLRGGDRLYLFPKRKKADRAHSRHLVRHGETAWDIAQRYGMQVSSLYKINGIPEGTPLTTQQWLNLR